MSATNKLRDNFPSSVIVVLVLLLIILSTMPFIPQVHRWGDTSTYYMQIKSIAEDQDIQYRPNDIERAIETRFDDLPAGLILVKTDEGNYFYGKEYTYALFSAPFYKLFGDNGILLFNALMFYAMILMGYLYLRKENGELKALCASIIFFAISTAFVYTFWIHVEIYNMFLIMLGCFLWHVYINEDSKKYLVLSSLIIGIAAVAKIPNIVLFTPLALYELYKYRFKNFAIMVLTLSIVIFMFYGYFYIETGEPSFYGGNRLYYSSNYPFLNGYDDVNEAGHLGFSVTDGRTAILKGQTAILINTDNLRIIPYNLYYYFFGRFTGVMWYYPLAIFALVSFLIGFKKIEYAKSDPKKLLILSGIILYILFFAILIGNNYLGGQHAVGNRYFYIYPAFLFLLGDIRYKALIPFLIISFITVTPIIADPIENSGRPYTHTFEFPYYYFPLEYSQLNNLPLWRNTQKEDIFSIYQLPAYSLRNNRKHIDYIVKTTSEMESFNVLIESYCENNTIDLKAGHQDRPLILDKYESRIISVQDVSPEYCDIRGYIYRIPVYSDGDLKIKFYDLHYPLSSSELLYGFGWYSIENWSGTPSRWAENHATLFTYSNMNSSAELNLKVLSYRQPRTLEIYVNGHLSRQVEVPSSSFLNVERLPIDLKDGVNTITFHTPDGCISPYNVSNGESVDKRCLSLAYRDIKLIRDILINDDGKLSSSSSSLSDGWHGLEDWSGAPSRWMENDAILMIDSEENRTTELSFRARSYNRPRTLELYDSEDNLIGEAAISENFREIKMPIELEVGANSIRLHTPEGCDRPSEVSEGKSKDGRCLSLAFQEVKIT